MEALKQEFNSAIEQWKQKEGRLIQNQERLKRRIQEMEGRNRDLISEVKVLEQERAQFHERHKKPIIITKHQDDQLFVKRNINKMNTFSSESMKVNTGNGFTAYAHDNLEDDSNNNMQTSIPSNVKKVWSTEPVMEKSLPRVQKNSDISKNKSVISKSDLDKLEHSLKLGSCLGVYKKAILTSGACSSGWKKTKSV